MHPQDSVRTPPREPDSDNEPGSHSGGLRVLIVDDSPEDRYSLRRALRSLSSQTYEVVEAATGAEGLEHCLRSPPHCVLLDYKIPDLDGLDFLDSLRERSAAPIALVMLTGQGSETVAAEAMKRGAADYLVKSMVTPQYLHQAISNAIEKAALRRSLVEKQAELERLAITDELTGLRNRRYVLERLGEEVDRSLRYKSTLALMLLDIDHFKQINDRLGHLAGDSVLASLGGMLKESVRITDMAGRYGGEEFIIVLPETRLTAAAELAERLRLRIRERQVAIADGAPVRFTCSFGVTESGQGDRGPKDLIARADAALYQAKRSGRDRVCQLGPDPSSGQFEIGHHG